MRNINISQGEHYHLFGRGNDKQNIFLDDNDYVRFLFLILHFQSPKTFSNIRRHTKHYVQHQVFNIGEEVLNEVVFKRFVELVAFSLMPNHYHLLIRVNKKNGAEKYMQRILNSFVIS